MIETLYYRQRTAAREAANLERWRQTQEDEERRRVENIEAQRARAAEWLYNYAPVTVIAPTAPAPQREPTVKELYERQTGRVLAGPGLPSLRNRVVPHDDGFAVSGCVGPFYDPRDPEGTQYEIAVGVFERYGRKAFDRTLASGQKVPLYKNHLTKPVYSPSIGLHVDGLGLHFRAVVRDTPENVKAVIDPIRNDELRGSSAGFWIDDVAYTFDGENIIREIVSLDLDEVSLTNEPAYRATSRSRAASGRKNTVSTKADVGRRLAVDLAKLSVAHRKAKRDLDICRRSHPEDERAIADETAKLDAALNQLSLCAEACSRYNQSAPAGQQIKHSALEGT